MKSPESLIKSLRILQTALLISIVVFLAAVAFLIQVQKIATLDIAAAQIHMTESAIILIFIAGVFSGNWLFKQRLKQVSGKPVIRQLDRYREAFIIRSAILEMNAFIALIAYYMLGHYSFVIMAGLCILMLLLFFPSKQKMLSDLQLKEKDLQSDS